jgi:hypothetical protein
VTRVNRLGHLPNVNRGWLARARFLKSDAAACLTDCR